MGVLLVANPGSSSRKYGLYETAPEGPVLRATINIEASDKGLLGTIRKANGATEPVDVSFTDITESAKHAVAIMQQAGAMASDEHVDGIAIRFVAPGSYFMHNYVVDDDFMEHFRAAKSAAPIHIENTLNELELLRQSYPSTPIFGVSDSAYHSTKPNYAWNYGIDIADADKFDIKRFGYHGISVQAAIDTLWSMGKLPPRVVVCHLGSGSSITAVFHGRSLDTTMGYSPLEGVLMATRSGTIDLMAARALKTALNLGDDELETYLNRQGGLLGIGGSADIRELIEREENGDHMAHLALTTLVHTYHKAIGSMIAALGGIDMLVFTGTVGERSAILRKRIVAHLQFADCYLDNDTNDACLTPEKPTMVSKKAQSKPIIVIPADEAMQIAKQALKLA